MTWCNVVGETRCLNL